MIDWHLPESKGVYDLLYEMASVLRKIGDEFDRVAHPEDVRGNDNRL